jgi:osmotically inducible protein OsmC
MPAREANARWEGGLRDGTGSMRFGSGAFEGAYSFASRFEEGKGTNPEELIGAAHAGCFSMALSKLLEDAGTAPQSIDTTATVHVQAGVGITRIDLVTRGSVPGMDEATFKGHAQTAKENCPVSKALASVPEITIEASLAG